jgi:protein KTI12
MAFITISGYPCSGKSTRAQQIRADFERRLQEEGYAGPKLSVEIVDDPVSKVTRESYDSKREDEM